ncbi:hypothetical protein CDEST_01262 [Colletotrichum destructivum]|uniref:Uncharacterized protein n=1 Tax=Colletotrichum destructivum TaxID=34406 RepID=A0AAX4HYJ2_9PEZI|nr:hypothetical protein CDEST_01262 [Colletotrichum destructivum]
MTGRPRGRSRGRPRGRGGITRATARESDGRGKEADDAVSISSSSPTDPSGGSSSDEGNSHNQTKSSEKKSARRSRRLKETGGQPAGEVDDDDDADAGENDGDGDHGAGSSKKRKGAEKSERPAKRAKGKARTRTSKGIWEQMEERWKEDNIPGAVKRFLNKKYPLKTLQELDEILPEDVVYDEDWDTEDEQHLQSTWEDDPERTSLVEWKKTADRPHHLGKLFKVCVRIFSCTPQQLISRANHLVFDTVNNHTFGYLNEDEVLTRRRTSAWSVGFCESLTQLIFHPLFQRNAKLLVVALQYAVMLRVRELQDWPLVNPTGETFFDALIDVIHESRGRNEHPKRLRRRAVVALRADGKTPPFFEQFMRRLEEGIDSSEFQDDQPGGKLTRPYRINATDLTNIKNALECMTHAGMPLWALTVKLYDAYGTKGRNSEAEVPTGKQLSKYYERDILATRRYRAKENNRLERIAKQSPDDHPPPDHIKQFLSRTDVAELRAGHIQTDASLRDEILRLRGEVCALKAELKSRDGGDLVEESHGAAQGKDGQDGVGGGNDSDKHDIFSESYVPREDEEYTETGEGQELHDEDSRSDIRYSEDPSEMGDSSGDNGLLGKGKELREAGEDQELHDEDNRSDIRDSEGPSGMGESNGDDRLPRKGKELREAGEGQELHSKGKPSEIRDSEGPSGMREPIREVKLRDIRGSEGLSNHGDSTSAQSPSLSALPGTPSPATCLGTEKSWRLHRKMVAKPQYQAGGPTNRLNMLGTAVPYQRARPMIPLRPR